MCAIFGYISKGPVPTDAHESIKRMFVSAQSRGKDASGFAYFDGANKLAYHKRALPATEMVKSDEFASIAQNMPSVFIGHCRLTTQGSEKNNANNHPVVDEKFGWAVVHNGVIRNDDELFKDKNLKLKRTAEVDTEIILRLFQKTMLSDVKIRPMSAIKKTVAEISGSMTFAMIGEECPNTLYLYRGDNPLVIVLVEKWNTIFFASTINIIEAGLRRTVTRCGGFFEKHPKIVDYWVNDDIPDETALRISIDNGQFAIRSLKAEKKGFKYTRSRSSTSDEQYEFIDEQFIHKPYRVGVGFIQLGDGSIVREGYDKDADIAGQMI